jgi:hypothetical protein
MRRSIVLFAAALALALTATAQSRADTMFWYNWDRNPFSISFVQKNSPGSPGTGGVNLIDLNSKAVQADATIGTGNPAADLQVISTADNTNPDMVAIGGGKYTLTLNVYMKDPSDPANAGQPVGKVAFNGQLQGSVTALSSNLTNAVLGSSDPSGNHPGQNFAQVTIGGETFTVTYSGFAEPGPSGSQTFGAISFHISGTPAIDGGKSPEPSGVVLGCLGLLSLGGVVWRARRRKAEALKAA